jgi:modulator of FtsH protease
VSDTAGWSDFLVATSGTAGALAGLVFVALSINLSRILQLPGISGRAAETIVLLAATLIGALLALVPGQPPGRLGLMLLVLWLAAWGPPTALQIKDLLRREYLRYNILRFVLHQAATLPLLLAALSLRGYLAGGLAWFALAVVLSITVGLLNAWVLLVEILR